MTASRHSIFTQPLISYAPTATWVFHGVSGTKDQLQQWLPTGYSIESVVTFVLDAHAVRREDPTRLSLVVPGEFARHGVHRVTLGETPPKGETALVCWRFWSEMFTHQEIMSIPSLSKTRWRKVGHLWTVWENPDDTLDGAFVTHDKDGTPNPVFTVGRRPFAELADALTVTDRIAQLADDFQ